MQRVGMDLLEALVARDDIVVEPLILRAAGLGMVVKAVPFYTYALIRIFLRCRSGEIDAVLFSAMASAWMAVLIKPLLRRDVPMATIAHGHDVIMDVAPYQVLVRWMYRTLDAVFPVSRATGEAVLDRGLPPQRLHVINNGIDVDRFGPPPDPSLRKSILRAAFPAEAERLPEGALSLCITGRQVRRKGHAWFIANVMPRLPSHVHLWLGGDGPEASAIAAACDTLQAPQRVHRLGLLTEAQIRELYRGADLFVMPNVKVEGDIEGFGIVILEASLNGMPAVGANLQGIRDAITDGENGVLVEPHDAEGFAAAILAFDRDRARLAALGSNAARFVREKFSWTGVAERYVEVLRALAKTSR